MKERQWTTVAEDDELLYQFEKAQRRRHLSNLPHPQQILVRLIRDGDFTTVIARAPHRRTLGEVIVDGASKKSMRDPERPVTGMIVAFNRALAQLDAELF
jgi:hypothetical protein